MTADGAGGKEYVLEGLAVPDHRDAVPTIPGQGRQ